MAARTWNARFNCTWHSSAGLQNLNSFRVSDFGCLFWNAGNTFLAAAKKEIAQPTRWPFFAASGIYLALIAKNHFGLTGLSHSLHFFPPFDSPLYSFYIYSFAEEAKEHSRTFHAPIDINHKKSLISFYSFHS
jgi:hypothetical protein